MRLGIVGSEAAKFTPATEEVAREQIRKLLVDTYTAGGGVDTVVSGGCHLGGIDMWAVEQGRRMGLQIIEHLPNSRCWSLGYRPRNILIARDSDRVVCITVKEFPDTYKGMKFPYCYHCKTDSHIKSGGCWTTKYARSLGKPTRTIVISAHEPYISEFFN